MSRSFVIHIHSGYGPTHHDLMLQEEDALATWQLATSPEGMLPGQTLPARPLPDHRSAYLSYEGPVSGGRGRVDRLDGGQYELISRNPSRWEFRLEGRRLRGRYELNRGDDPSQPDQWTLRRIE